MSGVHKNPTISFRISDYERREIEARIKASGMMKKTFFTRCCIYGRICVVGKKQYICWCRCLRRCGQIFTKCMMKSYKQDR